MSRMEQVNAVLLQELAVLLPQHIALPGGLITVTHISCSKDLRWANVYISVMPEKYTGTVLEKLRQTSNILTKELRNRVVMRRIPKFNWLNDATEARAARLDEVFKQIDEAEAETEN